MIYEYHAAGDRVVPAPEEGRAEPPLEPEAALLSSRAQIVDSEPIDLDWGSGPRFLLKVFGPDGESSDDQASAVSAQSYSVASVGKL